MFEQPAVADLAHGEREFHEQIQGQIRAHDAQRLAAAEHGGGPAPDPREYAAACWRVRSLAHAVERPPEPNEPLVALQVVRGAAHGAIEGRPEGLGGEFVEAEAGDELTSLVVAFSTRVA